MVAGFAEEGFDVGGLAVFGPAAGPRAVADLVELDREPVQALDRDADAPEPVAEDLAFLTPGLVLEKRVPRRVDGPQ